MLLGFGCAPLRFAVGLLAMYYISERIPKCNILEIRNCFLQSNVRLEDCKDENYRSVTVSNSASTVKSTSLLYTVHYVVRRMFACSVPTLSTDTVYSRRQDSGADRQLAGRTLSIQSVTR